MPLQLFYTEPRFSTIWHLTTFANQLFKSQGVVLFDRSLQFNLSSSFLIPPSKENGFFSSGMQAIHLRFKNDNLDYRFNHSNSEIPKAKRQPNNSIYFPSRQKLSSASAPRRTGWDVYLVLLIAL